MRSNRLCSGACSVLLLLVSAPAVAAQLFSTRSDGLTPALAGLFPDDWSDAVLNPAALPAGSLIFGRVEWPAEPEADRRAVAGARGAWRSIGWLGAGAVNVEQKQQLEHALIAGRYGTGDAVGLRYAHFRPPRSTSVGHSVLGAYRTEAGEGWVLDLLLETTAVSSDAARNRYTAGEILLRQPGPERGLTDGGWRYRLIRLRGGVGNGSFGSAASRQDALHWLEGSVAHLHSRRTGDLTLAGGWAVRYTSFSVSFAPCAVQCADYSRGANRRGLALDGALEALAVSRLALRAGMSWVILTGGDDPYAPRAWKANATLVPVRFDDGLWFGLGWNVRGGLSVDAALDALAMDDVAGPPPLTIQATYRF